MNLALIKGYSLSKYSSIINLNVGTSFVGTDALKAEISALKAQTRALALWPEPILEAY